MSIQIKKISVIGSGIMGSGIAHTFAQYGYHVNLVDINDALLQRALGAISKNLDRQVSKGTITKDHKEGTLNNIKLITDLKSGTEQSDLLIEAVTENLDLKLSIFKDLDSYCKHGAILASNTSSISITTIAASTKRPERVIGMHFMNPVPIMKLVEVIRGKTTSDEVTEQIMQLAKNLDKIPVEVNDSPGFVANRILMPMINEAIYTLHEGVAGVHEIDTVMKLGMGHPMGPLQLADFIGLDVCLAVLKVLSTGFNDQKYAACPLLVDMVNEGNNGIKSGSGFYDYSHGTKELIVAKRFRK
jgi:3-hydroxybutyryl-CoA dehydrogenase